jgi:hypothetical protein
MYGFMSKLEPLLFFEFLSWSFDDNSDCQQKVNYFGEEKKRFLEFSDKFLHSNKKSIFFSS